MPINEQHRRIASQVTNQVMQQENQRLLVEEYRYLDLGQRYRFRSLTTHSVGSMSIDEAKRTGQAFYSGLASSCFVVAVAHPDIGMGCAHLNTVQRPHVEDYVLRSISEGWSTQRLLGLANDPGSLHRTMVSADSRKETIEIAARQASDQFRALCGGKMPRSVWVYLCGGLYIEAREKGNLTNIAFNKVKSTLRVKDYKNENRLGMAYGVMFGYPGHQNFRSVSFLDIRNYR